MEVAVSLATEYDTVNGNNAPKKPVAAVTPAQPEPSLVDQVAAEVVNRMKTMSNNRASNVTCWGCGKKGHLQRSCKAPNSAQGMGRGSTQGQPTWPARNPGQQRTGTGNGSNTASNAGTTAGNASITTGNGSGSSN